MTIEEIANSQFYQDLGLVVGLLLAKRLQDEAPEIFDECMRSAAAELAPLIEQDIHTAQVMCVDSLIALKQRVLNMALEAAHQGGIHDPTTTH